jgi:hypothetical protein
VVMFFKNYLFFFYNFIDVGDHYIDRTYIFTFASDVHMLGGTHVTTAWRVLRLRMEETPSKYGAANVLNKQSRTADKG